jgi:hypothetical protein
MLIALVIFIGSFFAFIRAIDINALSIVACKSDAADICVADNSGAEWLLRRNAKYSCGSSQHDRMFKWIVRDELMSISWCADSVPRLSVLDARRPMQGELAFASIGAVKTAITVLIKAPTAAVSFDAAFNVTAVVAPLRLPVLVFGYDTELASAPNLCVFDPRSRASNAQCGVGFRAVSLSGIVPPSAVNYPSLFREVGAIAHDANGDGWSEVVLIFHATQATINVAPGASSPLLRQQMYDVGAANGVTVSVHSGRSYGIWAARVSGTTSGTFGELGIGGVEVGQFSDFNCNVSRFVAMLGALGLIWSQYLGFASSTWNNYNAAQCGGVASGGLACLTRPGDFDHKCVHRFDHGIGRTDDGVDIVAYNYFTQTSPAPNDNTARCLAEQYDLYQDPTWTTAKSNAWSACFARKHAESRGHWGTAFLHLWNGTGHTGGSSVYVWGTARNLTGLGGGNSFFVLETQPAGSWPFDLGATTAPAMQVKTLKAGLFQHVGTFPVPGRPKLRRAMPTDDDIDSLSPDWNIGFGSSTAMTVLTMQDVNCDGTLEMLLDTNKWVGWSAGSFVVVEPAGCATTTVSTTEAPITLPMADTDSKVSVSAMEMTTMMNEITPSSDTSGTSVGQTTLTTIATIAPISACEKNKNGVVSIVTLIAVCLYMI